MKRYCLTSGENSEIGYLPHAVAEPHGGFWSSPAPPGSLARVQFNMALLYIQVHVYMRTLPIVQTSTDSQSNPNPQHIPTQQIGLRVSLLTQTFTVSSK